MSRAGKIAGILRASKSCCSLAERATVTHGSSSQPSCEEPSSTQSQPKAESSSSQCVRHSTCPSEQLDECCSKPAWQNTGAKRSQAALRVPTIRRCIIKIVPPHAQVRKYRSSPKVSDADNLTLGWAGRAHPCNQNDYSSTAPELSAGPARGGVKRPSSSS